MAVQCGELLDQEQGTRIGTNRSILRCFDERIDEDTGEGRSTWRRNASIPSKPNALYIVLSTSPKTYGLDTLRPNVHHGHRFMLLYVVRKDTRCSFGCKVRSLASNPPWCGGLFRCLRTVLLSAFVGSLQALRPNLTPKDSDIDYCTLFVARMLLARRVLTRNLSIPLSEATVLTFLAPIATCYILSFLIPDEPFTRQQQIAGVVSLLGVLLIARPAAIFKAISGGDDPVGDSPPADGEPGGGFLPANQTSNTPFGSSPLSPTSSQHLLAIGASLLGVVGACCAYTTIRMIGAKAHPLISVNVSLLPDLRACVVVHVA